MPSNPFQNLPQGWKNKTLWEIGKVVSGGTPSTSNKDNFDGEIAWITPADLSGYKDKYISKGKRNLSEQGLKNSSAKLLPPNSILFSSRSPIGYVAIASNELCTNQGFKNLIPNDNVNSEYVFYFLLNSKRLAESVASGTTFKEISATNFSKLPIPLPPLETQQKIVAKLESEFAKIESAKSHLEKVKETIPRLKNSLLKSAFSGKLTRSCKDEKGAPCRHCEDSSESEAIYNAESPLKDSIAESKACKIVDCHELRCNSRNDKSVAKTPNFTQSPNLRGATLVAQNLQSDINSLGCHSEALAEESQNIKSHKDSILKDISAMPQYDKIVSICHSESPLCHSERSEESKNHFANAQYEKHSNLPQDWEIKTLGEIFLLERGGSPRPIKEYLTTDSDGINWIKIGDTKNITKYITETEQKIKPEGKKYSRFVEIGDLILSNSMSFGKPYIMKTTGCIHDGWVVFKQSKKVIDEEFCYYVLSSSEIYAQFDKLATGSTVKNLNIERIKQIPIPLPPLETQKQIVEILDSKFAALENLEKETNASLEKLQRLKSSLLNLAFKGELY